MQSTNQSQEDIIKKCEERATWLLSLQIPTGFDSIDNYEEKIKMLTKKIYDQELKRMKNGEESIFKKQNVIPDKKIDEEDE